MRRVLVTGSSGYIGSVLMDYLVEHGIDSIGYDPGFFESCFLYTPSSPTGALGDARDITDTDLDGIDAVVHLAGISNDPMGKLDAAQVYDPTRAYSLEIAKRCKRLGIKFIFASSCSVYGLGSDELMTETAPTQPQTPYSLNKLQIEDDLRGIADSTFSPIALRFATVFGLSPRIRFDVVVNMLTGLAAATKTIVLNSDGKAWRPNVHIMDACQAVRRAIEMEYDAGDLLVLNVGDEANNLEVIEIAKIVQAAIPECKLRFLSDNPELDEDGLIRDRKIKSGVDTRTYKVSFDRVRRLIPGFTCEWTVERGVMDMVACFQQLPLTDEVFKKRGFYRLQQLEHLHENGYLSDELRWLKAFPE